MTTDTTTTTFTLGPVGTEVDKRIRQLQQGALADRPAEVAALARLRRAVGRPPGSVPDVQLYTLSEVFAAPDAGDAPTPAEIAAHAALTFYATHQQSRDKRMHQGGPSLGAAMRALCPKHDPEVPPAVLRRFQTLGTSETLDELLHHLRGAVQLLRASDIVLDYGQLTDDLLRWQKPGGADRVRLRWGRDFHRQHKPDTSDTDPNTD
ncbi:CRISPR system Cascade subunit CasB [Crossiella equi]|uniref:CRISPR system Cascade subunit CasB n=1 Tax=Crossiella equi TaxID=130796 RepID=A0ABS5A9B5_9PSEU|nr:type I-E CRISPR-associated protein Cse2/CasB [Crossiella equi]MBP2473173.1 CRISPR system Cascade subunit CasB [Crossiella equi]